LSGDSRGSSGIVTAGFFSPRYEIHDVEPCVPFGFTRVKRLRREQISHSIVGVLADDNLIRECVLLQQFGKVERDANGVNSFRLGCLHYLTRRSRIYTDSVEQALFWRSTSCSARTSYAIDSAARTRALHDLPEVQLGIEQSHHRIPMYLSMMPSYSWIASELTVR